MRLSNVLILPSVALLTVAVGLAVDQLCPPWGQGVVTVATWLILLGLCYGGDGERRWMVVICMLYASLGEVVLSLVWHLYDYRLHNIPLFVPPGHALLFLAGYVLAQQLPTLVLRAAWIAAPLYALWSLVWQHDVFGMLLFVLFLPFLGNRRARPLYLAMFLLSTAMELYGTWLGNWTWVATVRGLQVSQANPPASVAVFYCVLDCLVVLTLRYLPQQFRAIPVRD